jgi:hypothetical protein
VQSEVHCIAMSSKGNAVFDLERHLGGEMIPEILAHAGEIAERQDSFYRA